MPTIHAPTSQVQGVKGMEDSYECKCRNGYTHKVHDDGSVDLTQCIGKTVLL